MPNTTRWIIDVPWTAAAFTAFELNSLASGGGALSTTVIANGTNRDQLIDVSFSVMVGGTTLASSFITIFVLPLNQDGTTFGDSYASSSTTLPALAYTLKNGGIGVKSGVVSGSLVTGIVTQGDIPPGDFKLAFGTSLGVALNTTANLILKYRTYNVDLNA